MKVTPVEGKMQNNHSNVEFNYDHYFFDSNEFLDKVKRADDLSVENIIRGSRKILFYQIEKRHFFEVSFQT